MTGSGAVSFGLHRYPRAGRFIMENPFKIDDLGVPPFQETPMFRVSVFPQHLVVAFFSVFSLADGLRHVKKCLKPGTSTAVAARCPKSCSAGGGDGDGTLSGCLLHRLQRNEGSLK